MQTENYDDWYYKNEKDVKYGMSTGIENDYEEEEEKPDEDLKSTVREFLIQLEGFTRRKSLWEKLAEKFVLIRLNGKIALEKNWPAMPRRNFDEIGFQKNDNAGIVCGPESGILGLDVDHEDLFREFIEENNLDVPETFTVKTGKGYHLYYLYPEDGNDYGNYTHNITEDKAPIDLKTGKPKSTHVFDIKGKGGYIVAPGSIHPDSKKEYEIICDIEIAAAPQWLLDLLPKKEKETAQQIKLPEHEILNCEFIRYCAENQADIPEPWWYAMISNVCRIDLGGIELCHEFSKLHLEYSKNKTDQKIKHALEDTGPHTCKYIQENGFMCSKQCQVTAPICLLSNFDTEEEVDDNDLLRERVPIKPFPDNALPEPIFNCLCELAKNMSVPKEMVIHIALGAISAGMGGLIESVRARSNYYVKGPLWVATIAGTGSKKTPVSRSLIKPILKKQIELNEKYKMDVKREQQENQKKSAKKGTKTSPPASKVKFEHIYSNDATIEAIGSMLQDNQKGILLNLDELASFIYGANQYRGGKGSDIQRWTEIWNADMTKIDRKSSPEPVIIKNPHVTIMGGIQPEIVPRIFKKSHYDNGLVPRFLFYVNDTPYQKMTKHEWPEELKKLWDGLIKLLYEQNDKKFSLKFSSEAEDFFLAYENKNNEKCDFIKGKLKVFFPKANTYVCRIAGMLHVLEHIDIDAAKIDVPDEISLSTVKKAIQIMDYYLGQARKLIELYNPDVIKFDRQEEIIAQSVIKIASESDDNATLEIIISQLTKTYNEIAPASGSLNAVHISRIFHDMN